MKHTWQKLAKQFFGYSRSDRNAVVVLIFILLVVIGINEAMYYFHKYDATDFSEEKLLSEQWEASICAKERLNSPKLFAFNPNTISADSLDRLKIPQHIRTNILKYRKAGGKFYSVNDFKRLYGLNDSIYNAVLPFINLPQKESKKEVLAEAKTKYKVELDYFDPNTIDEAGLLKLGFSNYQAKNLVAYRTKGGRFNSSEDVRKIYGMNEKLFASIKDFIRIKSLEPEIKEEVKLVKIELNRADSATLVQLPGIGPSYANRILRYRELLGGYSSPEQLLEIYNFPKETFNQVKDHFYADSSQINPIRINFSEYAQLIRHPYLNKVQVKAILRYRNRNGSYKNISSLSTLEGFDDETISKIEPYISCR